MTEAIKLVISGETPAEPAHPLPFVSSAAERATGRVSAPKDNLDVDVANVLARTPEQVADDLRTTIVAGHASLATPATVNTTEEQPLVDTITIAAVTTEPGLTPKRSFLGKVVDFGRNLVDSGKQVVRKAARPVAASALLVGTGAVVVDCGPAAPNATPSQTPSAEVSNSVTPTPINSETPTVEPTPTAEATPFVLPPVDSIINPSPSERPQTPITTQQLKNDVANLITIPNSGLSANDIKNINKYLQTCTDPNSDRLPACISLVSSSYHGARTLTNSGDRQAFGGL